MVIEVGALETIELRIALQWFRSSIGEVIAEAGIPSMGAQCSCVTDGCPGCWLTFLAASQVLLMMVEQIS